MNCKIVEITGNDGDIWYAIKKPFGGYIEASRLRVIEMYGIECDTFYLYSFRINRSNSYNWVKTYCGFKTLNDLKMMVYKYNKTIETIKKAVKDNKTKGKKYKVRAVDTIELLTK